MGESRGKHRGAKALQETLPRHEEEKQRTLKIVAGVQRRKQEVAAGTKPSRSKDEREVPREEGRPGLLQSVENTIEPENNKGKAEEIAGGDQPQEIL